MAMAEEYVAEEYVEEEYVEEEEEYLEEESEEQEEEQGKEKEKKRVAPPPRKRSRWRLMTWSETKPIKTTPPKTLRREEASPCIRRRRRCRPC